MRPEITTVGELVAVLTAYPPQTRVRLAVAPGDENRGNTTATTATTPTAEPVLEPAVAAEDKPKRRMRKKAAAEG